MQTRAVELEARETDWEYAPGRGIPGLGFNGSVPGPLLEAELSAGISRIHTAVFRPEPSDFACSTCPALDLVCAGPRLREPSAALEFSSAA